LSANAQYLVNLGEGKREVSVGEPLEKKRREANRVKGYRWKKGKRVMTLDAGECAPFLKLGEIKEEGAFKVA